MIQSVLRKALQRPISFHRIFAQISGDAVNGLFLSQLWYWHDKGHDSDGWIYKTYEEWSEETMLSRKQIDRARKSLKQLGILEEKKEGLPCKLFYRINDDALEEAILEFAEADKQECPKGTNRNVQTGQTRVSQTDKQERPKGANTIVQKGQTGLPQMDKQACPKWTNNLYTENTTENTTETTQRTLSKEAHEKTPTDSKNQKIESSEDVVETPKQFFDSHSLENNVLDQAEYSEFPPEKEKTDPYFNQPRLIERQRQRAKDNAIAESPFESVEEADQFYAALKKYIKVTARKGLTEGSITGIAKATYNRLLSGQSDPEDRELIQKWKEGQLGLFLDDRVDSNSYRSAEIYHQLKTLNLEQVEV